MKTFKEKSKVLIIPIVYIYLYFSNLRIELFQFLFSDLSIEIYKIINYKKGETLLIKPLDDIIVFFCVSWIAILTVLFLLFYIFKEKNLKRGIYITLVTHLFLLIYFMIMLQS
jgi:hypothetical protein